MALSKRKALVFIISLLVILLVISPAVFYFLLNFISDKKVADFASKINGDCKAVYNDTSYDIFSRHLKINGLSIVCLGEEALSFDEVEFNFLVSGKVMPSSMQADLRGGTLNIDAKFFGTYGKTAKYLGYTALPFHGRISYTLGEVSKEFNLVTFILNFENIGVFQAEGKVPDVTGATFLDTFKNIFNKKSSGFWISFSDEGLNNRVIEKYAEYSGKDVSEVRMKIENSLYVRMTDANETDKEKFSHISKYVENNSSISVQVDGKSDMSFIDFVKSFNISSFGGFLDSVCGLKAVINSGE